jgi:DNA-binding CsgD family transcriptional regulator
MAVHAELDGFRMHAANGYPALRAESCKRRLREAFVGRQQALARISEALADPSLVGMVVVGGEGAGKTRLLSEALRRLDSRQYATIRTCASACDTPFTALAEDLPPALLDVPLGGYALSAAGDALLRAADGRRLVLAIDDAHLIDDASATLASQLARRGNAFVLMTAQPGDPLPEPVATLATCGLADQVEVPPLTRNHVAGLLATVLSGPAEGLLIQRFWAATAGNPQLLCELISAELDAGAMTLDMGLWRRKGQVGASTRLVRLVNEKILAISAECRHTLELLALGEPLRVGVLGGLVSAATLEALEAKGLICVGQSDGGPSARLAYPLYAEVLRSAMPPLQAHRLRRMLVTAIEGSEHWADRVRAVMCDLDCGLLPAADAVVAAAWDAWHALDLPAAIRLARHAVSSGAGSRVAEPLGYGLMCAGRPGEAEAELAILSVSGAGADGLASVRAINYCLGLGRVAEAYALTQRAFEAASQPSSRTELAALGALLDVFNGRFRLALRRAASVQADPARTAIAAFRSLVAEGLAMVFLGRPATGTRILTSARQSASRAAPEMPWLDIMIEVGLIHGCLWEGDLGRAHERAASAYSSAVTQGWPFSIAMFALMRAIVAGLRGEAGAQILHCREGVAIAREHGLDAVLPVLLAVLGHGHAAAGDGEALAGAERSPHQPLGVLRPWIALARSWAGPGQATPARLESIRRTALAVASAGNAGFEALALHDLVRLGAPGLAAPRLRQLAARSEAGAAQLYAEHARAAADGDTAALGTVIARLEHLGSPLLAAEAAAEQCRWYRAAGRLDLASAALARAALLARPCGHRARGPAQEMLATLGLTPREREIAALAGQGLSNREISERLFLSVRTIENHLQRVYGKLGISGRGELAPRRPLFLDQVPGA